MSLSDLLRALHRAEAWVPDRYEVAYAGRHIVRVARQEEPRGLERLRALGGARSMMIQARPACHQPKRLGNGIK